MDNLRELVAVMSRGRKRLIFCLSAVDSVDFEMSQRLVENFEEKQFGVTFSLEKSTFEQAEEKILNKLIFSDTTRKNDVFVVLKKCLIPQRTAENFMSW